MKEKVCKTCGTIKPLEEFHKNKRSAGGCLNICKLCRSKTRKEYHLNNREPSVARAREWYYQNREKSKKNSVNWKQNNKLKDSQTRKKWYLKNKDKRIAYNNEWVKKKRQIDPLYATTVRIRSLIGQSLKGNKTEKTEKILGISFAEFHKFLGSKPEDAQLDHICPLSQAQTVEEVIKLNYYENFQWLPREINLRKSDSKTLKGEQLCEKLLKRGWIEK